MPLSENTPVIVGVGQFVERVDSPGYVGLSFADLAAAAAREALADTQAAPAVAAQVQAVGSIRTFEESGAMQVPFGRADKLPLAVARRLGIKPEVAILEKVGGAVSAGLAGRSWESHRNRCRVGSLDVWQRGDLDRAPSRGQWRDAGLGRER